MLARYAILPIIPPQVRLDMSAIVKGRVVSGRGEANAYVSLDWVRGQIYEKLGFHPYPGTLNLELSSEHLALLKNALSRAQPIAIQPQVEGFAAGLCYRVMIMRQLKGAIVLPNVPGLREDVIEVIAPHSLREALRLRDGDEISLEIL